MERLSEKEFKSIVTGRKAGERLAFTEKEIWNMDLSGMALDHMDFTLSSFQNTALDRVNFENSSVENALFDGCSMQGACFKNAKMMTASFRYCDMTKCNIEGADLYGAVLESANLEGILSDENTQWFRPHCPEEGAFLGYKKCVNDRIVQLLIPADAKRTSATRPSCRCSKAKVLTIKSFDLTQNFDEAWSFVDENFVYKKGEWVEVKDFNENRWQNSTTGIHFWMTRAEAVAY